MCGTCANCYISESSLSNTSGSTSHPDESDIIFACLTPNTLRRGIWTYLVKTHLPSCGGFLLTTNRAPSHRFAQTAVRYAWYAALPGLLLTTILS
jgi:hypothetical protein